MHDVVAHHLTVMVALSDGAVAASAASPERATDVMRSVSATGRRALGDTRRMLGVLRQQPGDDLGRRAPAGARSGRARHAGRAGPVGGAATTLEMQGSTADVPGGVQLTAYRLVQEALTNTLKHGGTGRECCGATAFLPGELSVDIEDDGAGQRRAGSGGVGGGLAGMQQRVHAYGGDVLAGRAPPGGWTGLGAAAPGRRVTPA